MARITALDPSFTRTGAVQIDTVSMEVCSHRVSAPILTKSFLGINDAVTTIVSQLDPLVKESTHLIMEGPFPNGDFSAGLFALDTTIYRRYCKARDTVVVNPTTMGHLHGKRSYKKSESVVIAMVLLDKMKEYGYKDKTDHRWSHDEAEALLYGVALAVSKKLFEEALIKDLLVLNKNLPLKGV